jgi:hypothetical protein
VEFRVDDLYLGLALTVVASGAVSAFLWARHTRRRVPVLYATVIGGALLMLSLVQSLPEPNSQSLDVVRAIGGRAESLTPPPVVRGERPSAPPARMTVVPVPTTTPIAPVAPPIVQAHTIPAPAALVPTTNAAPPVVTAAPATTTTAERRRRSDDD